MRKPDKLRVVTDTITRLKYTLIGTDATGVLLQRYKHPETEPFNVAHHTLHKQYSEVELSDLDLPENVGGH